MPRRYKGWKTWTIALRKRMYQERCTETTVTVNEVAEGLGADLADGSSQLIALRNPIFEQVRVPGGSLAEQ